MESETETPRRLPPIHYVEQEKLAEFAADANVMPLYEKSMLQYIYRRHYSMNSNEYLKWSWIEFKNGYRTRVTVPRHLPNEGDLQYHNFAIKLKPIDVRNRTNFRKSLKPGPGVDYGGQMPIPQEFCNIRPVTHRQERKINTPLKKNTLVNNEKIKENKV